MDSIVPYIKYLKSLGGLTQTGILLGLAGYGIKWAAHKVTTSIINTLQLQKYEGFNTTSKIFIALGDAAIETVVLIFSMLFLSKGLWDFIWTPLSLYPLLLGKIDVD